MLIKSQHIKPVTIGISCYGNTRLVEKTLTTLYDNTSVKLFHLIIRNDDPDDESMNSLLKHFKSIKENITTIFDGKNIGIVKANNQFIDIADSDFLVLMNSDILVTKKWLNHLLMAAKKYPVWDIFGCKLLYPDETIQHAGIGYFSKKIMNKYNIHNYWDFLPYHPKRGAEKNINDVNQVRELGGVTTALAMFRTNIFSKLGVFDVSYSPGMYDDPDFCLKAIKAGHKIGYIPKSVAYHLEGKSFERVNKKEIINKNAKYFLTKWEPWLSENLRDKYLTNIWGDF